MSQKPVAFMSYVRFDDDYDNGRLSEFRKRLSGEVRIQTGEEFDIFQDRTDIAWGERWAQRIDESIDAVTFLIPIITPGFLKSRACREELERFTERERQLGRNDLILPVYYVTCSSIDDESKREADPLARLIASRQYADWRGLRHEPFTSPAVARMIEKLALYIVKALERARSAESAAPAPEAQVSRAPPAAQPAREAPDQTRGAPRIPTTRTEPPARRATPPTDFQETPEIARGPAPKTEPPTRVVDALHRGDHSNLAEALIAARPGDRILVRPALYREGIVIDKPVEIIGDGELSEVVIEATSESAVLFKASMGRIANLTLRQAGGGDWFGIDIAQGRLDVEACDITSRSMSCVAIHGGADPTLRRNRIHDGKQAGILVYDNGQGTLEDNEISGNAYAGVEIKTGGNPTIRRNRIHDGGTAGIVVGDNGQGTLEDNDIFANAMAGVAIKSAGNPTLRRNRIHDGKTGGIMVWDNGQGTLEDNDIFANAMAGVQIKTGGNPTLRRNRIHDGQESGVLVWDKGQGTLEDNDIFANAYAGVEITTSGNPTLRRNRIHDGKVSGVLVWDDGHGTIEDNDISANATSGVEIKSGGNPTLSHNHIHDGRHNGIFVHDKGRGMLEDNDIVSNACAGVEVSTGGNPTVRRNRIVRNGHQAICAHSGAQGIFEDNDLRSNARGAWLVSRDSRDNIRSVGNQE